MVPACTHSSSLTFFKCCLTLNTLLSTEGLPIWADEESAASVVVTSHLQAL